MSGWIPMMFMLKLYIYGYLNRVQSSRRLERLISRWEHEHIIEAVQRRLDEHPEKMRQRR
jgi:hypothetical protein